MSYDSGVVEGSQVGQTFEGSFDLQPGESIVPGSLQTIGEGVQSASDVAADAPAAPTADGAADAPAADPAPTADAAPDAPPAPAPDANPDI